MTITIPESWLWVALLVLVLWPIVGLLSWAAISRQRTAESVLGLMSFWPLVWLVWGIEKAKEAGWFWKRSRLSVYQRNAAEPWAGSASFGPSRIPLVWVGAWRRDRTYSSSWVFIRLGRDRGLTVGRGTR